MSSLHYLYQHPGIDCSYKVFVICIYSYSLWEEVKKKIEASGVMNKGAQGFGRCPHAYTSGAQMHCDTEEFFVKLAMPVLNSYAMSEATGVITASTSIGSIHGSCGTKLKGVENKIISPDQNGFGR